VRERIGFLVVLRRTANPVHQCREPAVKVSIQFYAVLARAIITRQLIKLALYQVPFIGFRHHAYVSTDMTASESTSRSFNHLGNEQTEQAFIVG
jgi:hypothetical protein